MIGVDTGRENFYPRSPCGERLDKQIAQLTEQAFLSTLSLRRATTQMQAAFKGPEISIHALLAESDGHTHYMGVYEQISIHALLAESDSSACCGVRRKYNFYPRSPCGERQKPRQTRTDTSNFYPRSPCGERRAILKLQCILGDFYPRSPCGERPMGLDGRFKL